MQAFYTQLTSTDLTTGSYRRLLVQLTRYNLAKIRLLKSNLEWNTWH
jgi:hypothetical protein